VCRKLCAHLPHQISQLSQPRSLLLRRHRLCLLFHSHPCLLCRITTTTTTTTTTTAATESINKCECGGLLPSLLHLYRGGFLYFSFEFSCFPLLHNFLSECISTMGIYRGDPSHSHSICVHGYCQPLTFFPEPLALVIPHFGQHFLAKAFGVFLPLPEIRVNFHRSKHGLVVFVVSV
jgi:hypothetical protein